MKKESLVFTFGHGGQQAAAWGWGTGSSENSEEAQGVREHARALGHAGKRERKSERRDYVFELELRKTGRLSSETLQAAATQVLLNNCI